jgi:hypothetical protein
MLARNLLINKLHSIAKFKIKKPIIQFGGVCGQGGLASSIIYFGGLDFNG